MVVDKQTVNILLIILTIVMTTSGTIVITNYFAPFEALILFVAALSIFVFIMLSVMRRKK